MRSEAEHEDISGSLFAIFFHNKRAVPRRCFAGDLLSDLRLVVLLLAAL